MKLDIPYHSQYLEVKDSEWNIRSCSGSCVAMAMEFLTGKKIDILEYMKEAKREGGYDKINGASHDYIISYFEKSGLKSWRYKNPDTKDVNNDIAPLVESLENGNPVIVSINKIILEQKKFHLILLVGLEKNEAGEVTYFYYHEPEATVANVENNVAVGGVFRKCDMETFKQGYRGRAIFVSK